MVNDEVRAYYSEHHLLDLFDTLVNTTRSCPPKPVDVLLSSFLDNYGEQLSDEAITTAISKLNTLQGRRQSTSQNRPPNQQTALQVSHPYHIQEINNRRLEQIMHSMFPVSLCKNIIRGEQNLIEEYPAATVLFADIVGFTQLSRESSPQLVLRMLIDLFNAFDLMTADVHIEKIKTVGDCYMAAAGVPISQPDHANIALRCGVRMLGIVGAYQKQFNTRLTIRVGVASGPVLGGIIGKSKLAFDIWGFTCNLASRMETTAPVYSVQFPKSTMELTQQEFPNIQSNTVDVKGVGTMDTYVLYPNPQQLKEMDCAQYLKHKVGVSEKFDSRFLSEMFGY